MIMHLVLTLYGLAHVDCICKPTKINKVLVISYVHTVHML